METKGKAKERSDEKPLVNSGFIEFLKEKKARDGRLNKLGEWMLAKGDTGLYIREKDMKYILR